MAGTLKQRYDKLDPDRELFLNRAEAASKLTLPMLIPEKGHTSSTEFETPWQSIGSRGVNNLASKILLALFPPNSSFFRKKMDEASRVKAGVNLGEVEKALASYERIVVDDIEHSTTRSSLFQGAKHLIVGGNVLMYDDPKTGTVRMYPLSRYVVRRDAMGSVYEIVALDNTEFGALPKKTREQLTASVGAKEYDAAVEIYTGIYRKDNKWYVSQEIEGMRVEGADGTYPLDASPWIPLRLIAVEGESYGRGFIEEIYGDLNTLDALTQAVVESAAAGSVVKFLVNPNGVTDIDDIVDTPNGGMCEGFEGDVSVLQVNKFADLRVALEAMREIQSRLEQAFLMHSSVQRNAERVTAEEIRFMAAELEDALGGIYSVLAQELQLPLVNHRISRLTKEKKLPPLPDGVNTEIITGLEALGRSAELQRLRMFVSDAAQTFGPEIISEYVEVSEHLKRSAAALNLNTDGYIRDEDTVQANRKARAEAEAQAAAAAQPQPPQGAK